MRLLLLLLQSAAGWFQAAGAGQEAHMEMAAGSNERPTHHVSFYTFEKRRITASAATAAA